MARKKPSKKQDMYTLMVLKLLKELSKMPDARLSIREMSRILNIGVMAVHRAVKRIEGILDIKKGSEFESFRLQVYLIRLKKELKDLPIEDLVKKVQLTKKMNDEYYKR